MWDSRLHSSNPGSGRPERSSEVTCGTSKFAYIALMASRREWRVPFGATVRVLGTARSGQAYSATAQTIDISRRGARLGNAEFLTRLGEVITLQYQQRRTKFRVVWIGEAHGPERGLAGLELLENQPPLWGLD